MYSQPLPMPASVHCRVVASTTAVVQVPHLMPLQSGHRAAQMRVSSSTQSAVLDTDRLQSGLRYSQGAGGTPYLLNSDAGPPGRLRPARKGCAASTNILQMLPFMPAAGTIKRAAKGA